LITEFKAVKMAVIKAVKMAVDRTEVEVAVKMVVRAYELVPHEQMYTDESDPHQFLELLHEVVQSLARVR
jgi:hypothetical protein